MMRWLALLAPCALWLGVVSEGAARSQPSGQPLDQIATPQLHSNRNWDAFWHHHLGEWKGRWTRYKPSGDIEDSFLSSRSFTANASTSEVVQVNRYSYADGRLREKQWLYTLKDHSKADGLTHPAFTSLRGLAFNNGAAALLIPTLQAKQFAPFEFFLKRGDVRSSVALLYGQNGQLVRTSSIREERGEPSGDGWTDGVVQSKPWHPQNRWQGEMREINPDLSKGPVQQVDWQWTSTNQATYYFPDRIILRCPQQLIAGQPFVIDILWQVSTVELQIISTAYDNQRRLISVRHQSLSPQS